MTTCSNKYSEPTSHKSLISTEHLQLNFFLDHHGHDQRKDQCHGTRKIYIFNNTNLDHLNYVLEELNLSEIVIQAGNNVNGVWYKWIKSCFRSPR